MDNCNLIFQSLQQKKIPEMIACSSWEGEASIIQDRFGVREL